MPRAAAAKSKGRRRAADILGPTKERARHGLVERLATPIADEEGRISRPHKSIDILESFERKGTITREMRIAGEAFRDQFHEAHWDPLHASALVRLGPRSSTSTPGLKAQSAREAVWRALRAVGGLASPAGSCLWHIIGWEYSIKEWALHQGWSGRLVRQEVASGILIGALGALEAYYAGNRR